MTLIEVDPIETAVKDTYDFMLDTLVQADITKAVAVTAMLHVLGTIYSGSEMTDDDAKVFVTQAAEWLNGYFNGVV